MPSSIVLLFILSIIGGSLGLKNVEYNKSIVTPKEAAKAAKKEARKANKANVATGTDSGIISDNSKEIIPNKAFLKEGDASPENFSKNEGVPYSVALLDPDNIYPLVLLFPEETMYLKQEAVIQTQSGLYCVIQILDGEIDPDMVNIAQISEIDGKETIFLIDQTYEEYQTIGCIYGGLLNGDDESVNELLNTATTQESPQVAKVKKPSKKGNIIGLSLMSVYYCVWIILAFLGMFLGNDLLWTGSTAAQTKALNFVTGLIMLALAPGLGFFIALKAPFKRNKVAVISIIATSLALMLIMDILYFVLKAPYNEVLIGSSNVSSIANASVMLTVSLFLGQFGLIFLYGISLLHIDAFSFRKLDAGKCPYTSFGPVIIHLGKQLACGIVNILISVLRFKEKHTTAFLVIGTIALTLCIFVSAAVLIALIIILVIFAIILAFTATFSYMHVPQSNTSKTVEINDGGVVRTLTFKSSDFFSGRDIYVSDNLQTWYTDDGGYSFYQE